MAKNYLFAGHSEELHSLSDIRPGERLDILIAEPALDDHMCDYNKIIVNK